MDRTALRSMLLDNLGEGREKIIGRTDEEGGKSYAERRVG